MIGLMKNHKQRKTETKPIQASYFGSSVSAAFDAGIAAAANDPKDWRSIASQGESFQTVHDYKSEIKSICEDYVSFTDGLYEALQKEAFQNCIDSCQTHNFNRFKARMDLRKNHDGYYLMITDDGCGLTGSWPKTDDDRYDEDPDQRMSRFMSHGFGKTGANAGMALGGRGRGKCLLVGCSEKLEILLETRFGARHIAGHKFIDKSTFPTRLVEFDRVKAMINGFDPQLKLMLHGGTRIMIPSLKASVVQAIMDGSMERKIGITWFDLITRFDLPLYLNNGTDEKRIKVPADYAFPSADTDELITFNQKVPLVCNRIKHSVDIHLVYAKSKPVAEDIRGIALVRGGMVIKRIPVTGSSELANIYGYVRMSPSLEEEMKKLENPTHCDFDLNRGAGLALRHLVEAAGQEFAQKKLGMGGVKSNQPTQEAADRGIAKMKEVAKKLGLKLPITSRPPAEPRDRTERHAEWPVHIQAKLKYPNEDTLRVNYGQSIRWDEVLVTNTTDQALKVTCVLDISSVRGLPLNIFTKVMTLAPHQVFSWKDATKKGRYAITKSNFAPGEYCFTERTVLSAPAVINGVPMDIGTKFQSHAQHLFINEDPPQPTVRGFLKPEFVEFPPHQSHWEYEVQKTGSDSAPGLKINALHPTYVRILAIKDPKAQNLVVESFTYEKGIDAMMEISLGQDESEWFPDKASKSPGEIFQDTQRLLGRFKQAY